MKIIFVVPKIGKILEDIQEQYNCSKARAWQRIENKNILERGSSWGISSRWDVVKEKGGYTITIQGPRHSLHDWCPNTLMEAADKAWIGHYGFLIDYESERTDCKPSAVGLDTFIEYPEISYHRKCKRPSTITDSSLVTVERVIRLGFCLEGVLRFRDKYLGTANRVSLGKLIQLTTVVDEYEMMLLDQVLKKLMADKKLRRRKAPVLIMHKTLGEEWSSSEAVGQIERK